MSDTRPSFAIQDKRLWYYRVLIVRVVDGDTLDSFLDTGFGSYRLERLRLAGVDAPELHPRHGTPEERDEERQLAIKARDRVQALVGGRECLIRTYKTDSFGRYIAQVFLPDDVYSTLESAGSDPLPTTVNDLLLREGLAQQFPAK